MFKQYKVAATVGGGVSDQKCNDPVCHVEMFTEHSEEKQTDTEQVWTDICATVAQKKKKLTKRLRQGEESEAATE